MRHFFTVAFVMLSLFSFAQSKSFKITGTIVSDVDKAPLESATVYLERVKDSSMVIYTISDKNGDFVL